MVSIRQFCAVDNHYQLGGQAEKQKQKQTITKMRISKEFKVIIGAKELDCVEYKGKLFTYKTVGVGPLLTTKVKVHRNLFRTEEYYVRYEKKIKGPIFSKEIIEMLGAGGRVEKAIEKAEVIGEYTDEIIDSVLDCIYGLGLNLDGVLCLDKEAEKKRKEQEEGEKRKMETAESWAKKEINIELGYFGWKLKNQIPKEIWQEVEKYAKYWSQYNIDTYFDFAGIFHDSSIAGWYYTKEAIEKLESLGWTLLNNGRAFDSEKMLELMSKSRKN